MTHGASSGSLRGMEPLAPIAPLAASLKAVRAVADDLEALCARPPADARDLMARIAAAAAELRAIGGPIDPNAPAGL